MVKEITLNNRMIQVDQYKEECVHGSRKIAVSFQVTSDDYHDIATLLYAQDFDVGIPEKDIAFRGTIKAYATSITNLYKPGQVAEYHLTLLEMPDEERGR